MSAGIRVTVVGAIVNILLAIIKFIFGILGNSRALVADAVHSMSDLASDIVVVLGLYFGGQPADKDHHFGHKKIETGEEYHYNSKVLCEECCFDIRTPRVRKTHWQYLGSIKTEYLIPGKST